ncbi:MAG: hypothetical protein Q4P13_07395 [Psychrobacter sp.]|nr:hypothetical protein [Psychrobacter sp.]
MSKDRSINALNGHLHDQLATLLDPDLTKEQLETEVARAKAVSNIASKIIDGERVINERAKIVGEYAPKELANVLMPAGISHVQG